MSWSSRLHKMKEVNIPRLDDLDSVFVSGSKFAIDEIINELRIQNSWADISKISLSNIQLAYPNEKILECMKNNRFDSKIYKHCDIDLMLIQNVIEYIPKTSSLIEKDLIDIFTESVKLICSHESDTDTSKTIFILDFTHKYFERNLDHINELLLYSSSALALISKRHLFPFIEFVIISDCGETSKQPLNIPNSCEIEALILHIQQKLKTIDSQIKVYSYMDMDLIIKLIMVAHTTQTSIDFELV